MNIDNQIIKAISVIKKVGIVDKEENFIEKTFRGQISSFGAAITTGSLLSAIAFYSNESNSSDTDRPLLMKAIYILITGDEECKTTLLEYVINNKNDISLKKQIIDAAVAIKLAMNAYELRRANDKENSKGDKKDE